jgi:hypothetical protein
MNIGLACSAANLPYGDVNNRFMPTCNIKKICELLIEAGHDVTILTHTVFVEPKPNNIKYDIESLKGKYDVVLLVHGNSDIFMQREQFRTYYIVENFEYKKIFEIVIDSDISNIFSSTRTTSKIFNLVNLRNPELTKVPRFNYWLSKTIDFKENTELTILLTKEKWASVRPIFNASSGYDLVFPWTLLEVDDIEKWVVPISLFEFKENIYVGKFKKYRIKKLNSFNFKTALYTKLNNKNLEEVGLLENIHVPGRIKMNKLPEIMPEYTASVVIPDKKHEKKGWILRRMWEASRCGVPAPVHETINSNTYGFTNVTGAKGFNLSDQQINEEFYLCQDPEYKRKFIMEQKEVLDTINNDFASNKIRKINEILEK